MSRHKPSTKLGSFQSEILKQYTRITGRRGIVGLDLVVNVDEWLTPVAYLRESNEDNSVRVSRSLAKHHWSWLSWCVTRCDDWHVMTCPRTDETVLQWDAVKAAFAEARFGSVPELRIRGNVYLAVIDQISYHADWITNRRHLIDLCGKLQRTVDERMKTHGIPFDSEPKS